MGSGSSVVVQQPHIADAHFKQLLSSKAARNQLFEEISHFQIDDHITLKGKISLKKLVGYFDDVNHALYPGFSVNVDILSEAYKFTSKNAKSKNKKKAAQQQEQLSLKDFHKFLPTLLLFDRLWDLFDAADKFVIEDKRVFKGEFVGMYKRLHTLGDIVVFGSLSQEEWESEFSMLDKNNDDFINFNEFCAYCVAHIERPFDFNETEDTECRSDSEEEAEDTTGGAAGLIVLHTHHGEGNGASAVEDGSDIADASAVVEPNVVAAVEAELSTAPEITGLGDSVPVSAN